LHHLKQPEVATLIDGLIASGHIEQVDVDRNRPVVRLTDSGKELMQGQTNCDVELPVPPDLLLKLSAKASADATRPEPTAARSDSLAFESRQPYSADPDLIEALKGWRREVAAEAGLPQHYVLPNATLDDLARLRPETPEGLLQIKGIGAKKQEMYGQALLRILGQGTSSADERDSAESLGEPEGPATEAAEARPSHYWTWRLLSAGFTPEECMAIRGVSREVVIDHALSACEEGRAVRAEWCLSGDLIAAMEELVGHDSRSQPATLLSRLPPGTRNEELTLFLRCRQP
jgi:ATP-dependent DNA helicase RecQ